MRNHAMRSFSILAVALAGCLGVACCADAADDDPFTVVKVLGDCKYFIARGPVWYAIAEPWMCSKPSEGDSGTGNLVTYSSTKVTLNGSKCDLWIETWGGESTVLDRLQSKCR